jgi:hypothetical protein
MRKLIAQRPMAVLVAVLGAVVAATGIGSLALAAGVPVTVLLYTQLAIYVALPVAIVAMISARDAGAAALAISAALPVLTFFAWLEYRIAGNLAASFGLVAAGTSMIYAAIQWLAPRDVPVGLPAAKPAARPKITTTGGRLMKRSA